MSASSRSVRPALRAVGRIRRLGREWWIAVGAGVVAGAVAAAVNVGWPITTGPRDCGGIDQLVLATGTDLSLNRQRQTLIDLWNAQRPADDPAVVQEELPGVADEHRSQMIAVAQSGSCRYDVLNLDLPWIEEFHRAGLLRPLTGIAGTTGAGFLRPSWEAGVRRVKGTPVPFAIPFNADAGLLYYRTDLLAGLGLGPPRTWADVDKIAERLGRPGEGGPRQGPKAAYGGQFAEYEGLTVNLLEVLRNAGTDLVRQDGTEVIDSPQAQQALGDLVNRISRDSPVISPESAQSDESATLEAFAEGEVVLMRNWPYAFRVLAADPDLAPGGVPKFGVTQLPVGSAGRPGSGVLGGQSLAVTKRSRHPAAAERLIRFLTDPAAQQLQFSCGGYAPVREAAFEAVSCADAEKALGVPPERRTGTALEQSDRETDQLKVLATELRRALENARPRPVTPYYGEFTAALQRAARPFLEQREHPGRTGYDTLRRAVCVALTGTDDDAKPAGCG